jgi:glycosyltransferase involved in cell wall biosynthesis
LCAGIPAENIEQISNGVDTDRFPISTGRGNKKTKLITYIGRMDAFKGVEYLLDAFRQVIAGGADARLQLIGTGPDEDKLKRIAAHDALTDKVIFKGRRENVLHELSETDIFVLPSLSEGMSNVLLEAMSCALPVVVTGVGGALDMIRHGINGMLVPPGDPEALRDALVYLMSNESFSVSLGREARKTIEERYALSHTADCYRRLYGALTASSPAMH